jgi:pimeloyl-ACP methyl ester carboxylesterase
VRRLAAALVLAALVAAGCSSDDDSTQAASSTSTTTGTTTTELTAPAGDAFYHPPDPLPPGKPGDVIWAGTVTAPEGTRAWRILYRSTTVKGDPTAVSALLFAPATPPTGGGGPTPILAYAHGTTGLADRCAPSKQYVEDPARGEASGITRGLLDKYVVVATDYAGLGTPGVHPYAVGLSEGRDVLDSIRAAQRFSGDNDLGATARSTSVVWGHSQGGGAALLTAELAPTYAPDANLAGAVAGAPASELKLLGTALRTSPFFGYIFMAAAGFHAAYPELDESAIFTPDGIAAVEKAADSCSSEIVNGYRGKDPNLYMKADPGTTEPFASVLEENSPGVRATKVPVFMYHGEADEQIPVIASKLVLDRYCRNGTTAYRTTYPGATHTGVIPLALAEIESYIADRVAGKPAPTSCT